MSAAVESERDEVNCCAYCGVAGVDDIKLKDCSACHLVKYCSVNCQRDHRPKHKKECKKRAAELHDEILFQQPESIHLGDCPICCLPQPIDQTESLLMSCCSKLICNGCNIANKIREAEGRLQHRCPFCRKPVPSTDEQINELLRPRIEANDPVTLRTKGAIRFKKNDFKSAFEYWSKAATLGDAEAHYQLSFLCKDGRGVEKDMKRAEHHLEQAAIKGHPCVRHNLGWFEEQRGKIDRAARHFIIAAKLGLDMSLQRLKELHKFGFISKDDFATALRGHQAAIDATKSPQREEAAEFLANRYSELYKLPAD